MTAKSKTNDSTDVYNSNAMTREKNIQHRAKSVLFFDRMIQNSFLTRKINALDTECRNRVKKHWQSALRSSFTGNIYVINRRMLVVGDE